MNYFVLFFKYLYGCLDSAFGSAFQMRVCLTYLILVYLSSFSYNKMSFSYRYSHFKFLLSHKIYIFFKFQIHSKCNPIAHSFQMHSSQRHYQMHYLRTWCLESYEDEILFLFFPRLKFSLFWRSMVNAHLKVWISFHMEHVRKYLS